MNLEQYRSYVSEEELTDRMGYSLDEIKASPKLAFQAQDWFHLAPELTSELRAIARTDEDVAFKMWVGSGDQHMGVETLD